jgi:hypothetical protein
MAADAWSPCGLCFMSDDYHVAVCNGSRVSVFTVDGAFVRHVGVGILKDPSDVACSAFDELVVADGNDRVCVFTASGELAKSFESRARFGGVRTFKGVALHGGSVFAQESRGCCVVFE